MKAKYQSNLLGSIHETAESLYRIGAINEKEMREYDDDCLVKEAEPAYTATASKQIPENAVRPVA